MARIVVLLFAAGSSRRMGGRDKLMERIDGEPLLHRQARAALASCCPVIVLLPPGESARPDALRDVPLCLQVVPDAAEGMGASFRAGIAALPADTEAATIMLADMPDIDAGDLKALHDAWTRDPERPHRLGTEDGAPGSPVLFPQRLFPALARLTGDTGGRDVLAGEDVGIIVRAGRRALTDLDTPEDWAAWRRRRGNDG